MAERIDCFSPEWYNYGWEHMQRYMFASKYLFDKSVIDVGCGIGYGSYMMKQLGASSVHGIDISLETIEKAITNHSLPSVTFSIDDAMNLSEDLTQFDCAVSFENIEHLSNPELFVNCITKKLKPNGLLIVSAPNKFQFTLAEKVIENEYHLSEPSYEDLKGWLSSDFEIIGEFEQCKLDFIENILTNENLKIRNLFFIKLLIKLKDFTNVFFSKKDIKITPNYLLKNSEIIPLLPNRRKSCTTFLFICVKKNNE